MLVVLWAISGWSPVQAGFSDMFYTEFPESPRPRYRTVQLAEIILKKW